MNSDTDIDLCCIWLDAWGGNGTPVVKILKLRTVTRHFYHSSLTPFKHMSMISLF